MLWKSRILPISALILCASLLVTPVCGRWFHCGCAALWDGLFAHCAALRGVAPGCPWCEQPILGAIALVLPLLGGIASARLGRRFIRRRHPALREIIVSMAGLLLGTGGGWAVLEALGALTYLLSQGVPR